MHSMADLTLIIGNKNYSSWSLRPWILMKRLGLEFREVQVRLDTPEFKDEVAQYGPSGRVPVLTSWGRGRYGIRSPSANTLRS